MRRTGFRKARSFTSQTPISYGLYNRIFRLYKYAMARNSSRVPLVFGFAIFVIYSSKSMGTLCILEKISNVESPDHCFFFRFSTRCTQTDD